MNNSLNCFKEEQQPDKCEIIFQQEYSAEIPVIGYVTVLYRSMLLMFELEMVFTTSCLLESRS